MGERCVFRGILRIALALLLSVAVVGCASSGDKEPKDPVAEHILELEKAAAAAPSDARAQYVLGNAYFDAKRYAEARSAYSQATTLDPNFADAYTNLGLTYRVEGDIESAIAQYEKALVIAPNDVVTRRNLIVALESAQRYPQATSHLAELSRQTPDDLDVLRHLAVLYQNLGQFPEAESAYTRLLAKSANEKQAWFELGICQEEQQKSEAAIASWRQALAIDNDFVKVHEILVEVYTRRSDYTRAWEEVREVQRLGGFVEPTTIETLQEATGKLGPD